MHPKMMTKMVLSVIEGTGPSKHGVSQAKNLEKGSPPSAARACVVREEAVRTLMDAKSIEKTGNMRRVTDPPALLVA